MNKKKVISSRDLLFFEARYGNTKWAKKDKQKIGNLITRMSLLEKNEKSLIMKLTDNFCYIDTFDFLHALNEAFTKILSSNTESNHIIISPLKSPFHNIETDKSGRYLASGTKSPDLFYAMFKNTFIPTNYDSNVKFQFCDTPTDIAKSLEKKSKIILIDDFIGSGNTAVDNIVSYLSYLEGEDVNVKPTQFSILVIAAMNAGVEYIRTHTGVSCYYNLLQHKGITEDIKLNTKTNIELMKSIETKVLPNLNPSYSFGYKKSESLVSIMEKSPNNTFPFYWYSDSKTQLKPIFRRNIL